MLKFDNRWSRAESCQLFVSSGKWVRKICPGMVYFATIIQRAVLRVQSVQGVATCSFLHGVFLDIDQIIPLKSLLKCQALVFSWDHLQFY